MPTEIIYRSQKGPAGEELYNLTPDEVDANFRELALGKVDTEDGKGLSSNDLTDELVDKINEASVQKTVDNYDPIWEADYNAPTTQSDLTPPWLDKHLPALGVGLPVIQDAITIVSSKNLGSPTDKFRPLGDVMKVDYKNGYILPDGGSYRAEVLARYPSPLSTPANQWPDKEGDERFYGYSVYIPESHTFATDTKWLLITQLKGYLGGSPMISVELNRSNIRFGGVRVNEGKIPVVNVPVVKGTFHRVIFGVKLSPNPNVGWFEGYINGVNVIPRMNVATMQTINGVGDSTYLKQGIYRAPEWNVDHVLYFSATKIGTTYGAVASIDPYVKSANVAEMIKKAIDDLRDELKPPVTTGLPYTLPYTLPY